MSKGKKKKDYRKYLLVSVIALAVIINGVAFYVNHRANVVASAEENLAAVSGSRLAAKNQKPILLILPGK